MDPREQRAIVIAAMCRIDRKGDTWFVPSQSAAEKRYTVNPNAGTCDCPDHEAGFVCKHARAVRIVIQRETGVDGTIIETKSVTFEEKKVYKQNWAAMNAAQSVEKDRIQSLLNDLCQGVPEPAKRPGRGRQKHLYRDSIFAMAMKVYTGFSSRRFSSDLRESHERGHVSKPIPGLKVNTFFENPIFTPILTSLVVKTAAPLRAVETDFAVDSSGFSTSNFETWYDHKYGVTRRRCMWVKVHIACGVKTNVVTAVRILDKDTADSPQFKPLVETTSQTFAIREMSADKAYASEENFQAVQDLGGTGYIPFKSNTTGGIGGLFEKMFHYFLFKQDEYLSHYHKRSNVESVFSACKRKFGDSVRSRTATAMHNEVLCKFICHNLCVLIQEQHELGIEPIFWDAEPTTLRLHPQSHQ